MRWRGPPEEKLKEVIIPSCWCNEANVCKQLLPSSSNCFLYAFMPNLHWGIDVCDVNHDWGAGNHWHRLICWPNVANVYKQLLPPNGFLYALTQHWFTPTRNPWSTKQSFHLGLNFVPEQVFIWIGLDLGPPACRMLTQHSQCLQTAFAP